MHLKTLVRGFGWEFAVFFRENVSDMMTENSLRAGSRWKRQCFQVEAGAQGTESEEKRSYRTIF